jgi:hypothetical protein
MASGRLMDANLLGRATVTLAVLLGALAFVTWRQSRTFEALEALEELRRRTSIAAAERVELERTIQFLESRARVVPEARRRLDMHLPDANELVFLPGEDAP